MFKKIIFIFLSIILFFLLRLSFIKNSQYVNSIQSKNAEIFKLNKKLALINNKSAFEKEELIDTVILIKDRNGVSWNKYLSTLYDNKDTGYTILYPKDWVVSNNVFSNEDGRKVAEIIGLDDSGISKNCSPQSYGSIAESIYQSITVDEKPIKAGRYQGFLRISQIGFEGGSPEWSGIWYPNEYCIIVDNKSFFMTFYENQEVPLHTELYEKILSTIKVLN